MHLPLAPASLFVQLFDAFSVLSLLFVTFIPCLQDGPAASVQVDMQIEAAARLKSTLFDLSALEISRNISFGAPPPIFVISENSSSSAVHLHLAPASLFFQLFDEFSALSLLFVTFIPCFQDGSAASVQVDMQIEAAARLKSTLSDLPALEISRSISFGAPPHIFSESARVCAVRALLRPCLTL